MIMRRDIMFMLLSFSLSSSFSAFPKLVYCGHGCYPLSQSVISKLFPIFLIDVRLFELALQLVLRMLVRACNSACLIRLLLASSGPLYVALPSELPNHWHYLDACHVSSVRDFFVGDVNLPHDSYDAKRHLWWNLSTSSTSFVYKTPASH